MPRGAGLAADRGPNTASPDAPAGRRRGTKTTHTKEYPADVRYWDKGRAPREDVPQGTEPAIPDSGLAADRRSAELQDRKSTRLNSSHVATSYAVFCLKQTTL